MKLIEAHFNDDISFRSKKRNRRFIFIVSLRRKTPIGSNLLQRNRHPIAANTFLPMKHDKKPNSAIILLINVYIWGHNVQLAAFRRLLVTLPRAVKHREIHLIFIFGALETLNPRSPLWVQTLWNIRRLIMVQQPDRVSVVNEKKIFVRKFSMLSWGVKLLFKIGKSYARNTWVHYCSQRGGPF